MLLCASSCHSFSNDEGYEEADEPPDNSKF